MGNLRTVLLHSMQIVHNNSNSCSSSSSNINNNNNNNWRASVASETLKGVKMKKLGMFVYLYICMDVRMSFCTLTLAFLC